MRTPITTGRFEKDVKRMGKRGKDLSKLTQVLRQLIDEEPLEARQRDHALSGNYAGHRECHIEPDWLLIYQVGTRALRVFDDSRGAEVETPVVIFERTGTHADLFE
jgi:mRNA interferase YafQ